ncbi:MAG: D-beta-D-heptose 7-phosphate kinase / D-beta-D-heptose 1-phosphate adenosyltransferase [Parcubacteria group bacterium Gr01-1014_66]|nr:MAG: D-beta-D-heptose 7-phosphate kinase / D-beta-D-heptose 1-phosphate adenosyltransferase [Parcubacteria group bacterium Gr01-1014_66]
MNIRRRLEEIVVRFEKIHVCVVGDVMLDQYLFGDEELLRSEQGSIPLMRIQKECAYAGGAANPAMNAAVLGAQVTLIGACGKDHAGDTLIRILSDAGIEISSILIRDVCPTIQKIRIIGFRPVMRIDKEKICQLSKEEREQVIRFFRKGIRTWHAVVVSDYAKGFFSALLTREFVRISRDAHIPLYVDVRPAHFSFFRGARMFTPNVREAEAILGHRLSNQKDIQDAIKKLAHISKSSVMITQGARGMTFLDGHAVKHLSSLAREVVEDTGAGDTVLVVYTLAHIAGASVDDAALLANIAAGIVVGKPGTATLSQDELIAAL